MPPRLPVRIELLANTDRSVEVTEAEQLTEELVQLLDRSSALPRAAGRIFVALLTSDEPYLSGPELVSRLGISSGSVSTMTRLLEELGFIERFGRPKIRADLFRIRVDHMRATIRKAIDLGRHYQELAAKLQHAVDSDTARARLEQFGSLHGFIADTLAVVADTWDPDASAPSPVDSPGTPAGGW